MNMPARLRSLRALGLLPLLLGGCVAPWPALATCPEEGCAETDTDGATSATTFSSVTIDPNSSGSPTSGGTTGGDSDATSGATTDAPPAAPPTLESYSLSTDESQDNEPLVIQKNGAVRVYAEATDADGVRVELDDGAVIELVAEVAGVFRGELAVVSSLANGDHKAKLVPYSEDYGDGKPALEPYTINLPMMGDELLWAVDKYLGKGWLVDVELLPNGDIIELGNLLDDNNKRTCFLRRRNPQGAYDPGEVVTLLGGDRCEAVGLEVRGDRILVLASWKENGGRWWLGDMPGWGSTIFPYAQGEAGDTATAFRLRADGAAVISGTTVSGYGDLDAFVWVLESGEQPEMRVFDYVPEDQPDTEHEFDETPRDLFVGEEQIVLVGSAYGKHDKDDEPNKLLLRRFFLPVDLSLGENEDPPPFFMAAGEGPGNGTQSIATAADIDDQGRLLITGYTCELPCEKSQGHLWVHHLDGTLDWFTSLGLHDYPEQAPRGLRAHPAGYAVVGNGGLAGDASFMLRAFTIGDYEPLWTYARSDPFQEHFPVAVTIGLYGQICAGGFGNGIYPGVACVGS